MGNILYDMRDSLIRYSEAIAEVIDAAVSVVDDQQIRVLYKGKKWSFQSGVSMVEKGNIVRAVIDTGETQVMLEPHGHPACETCPGRRECEESVEIWTAITVNGKRLGAIGFICETKRQQRFRKGKGALHRLSGTNRGSDCL